MSIKKVLSFQYTIPIFLLCLFFINIISINASAQTTSPKVNDGNGFYTEQFQLEKGNVRYYVTALDQNQTWYINLTSVYHGIFYLFIFDERPQSTYVQKDGSLDSKAYSMARTSNCTPVKINSTITPDDYIYFVDLSFKANETKLFYLMVYLSGGASPDTFVMHSDSEVQAYFIPFLDGYPFEFICISFIFTIIILRKKIKNH
jgi:hypothetical protein